MNIAATVQGGKELGPVKAIGYWPSSQKFLLTLPVAEPARLINFVTRAVLNEKLLGTNSILLIVGSSSSVRFAHSRRKRVSRASKCPVEIFVWESYQKITFRS
jgi:hypothetical protein